MNMGIHTLEDNVRLTLELKQGGLVRFGADVDEFLKELEVTK